MSFWNIFKTENSISLDVKKILKTDVPDVFYNPSDTVIHVKDHIEYRNYGDGEVIKEKIIGNNFYLVEYDIKDMLNSDLWSSTLTKEALTEDDVMEADDLWTFPASSDHDANSSWDSNPSLDNDFDFASLLPCPDHIRLFNAEGDWTEEDFITGPHMIAHKNDFGAKLEEFEIKVGKRIQLSSFKLILRVNVMETAYEPEMNGMRGDFKWWPDDVIKDFTTNREHVGRLRFGFYLKSPQESKDEFIYLLSAEISPTKINFITFVDEQWR